MVVISDLLGRETDLSSRNKILELASAKCVPCDAALPISVSEAELLKDLSGWSFDSSFIVKEFRFEYSSGLEFAHTLGQVAEVENHHPDMLIGWRRVRLSLSTHTIHGLSQNDFIMAAKAELAHQNATDDLAPYP